MAYWNQTELNAALSADVPATKSTIISVMQAAGLYPSGPQRIVGEEITSGGLKGEPALAPGVPTAIVIDTNTTSTTSTIAVNSPSKIVVATAAGGKDVVYLQSSDATVVSGSTTGDAQRFYFVGSATSGTFYAGAGDDIVYGGEPNVAPNVPLTVIAGTGTSRVFADGDIHASAGGSTIITGQTATSHNTVTGGASADNISVVGGFNTVTTGGGVDRVYLLGGTTNASLDGSVGDIGYITGGSNHVTVSTGDQLFISGGSNTIDASAGDDVIKITGGASSIAQGASNQVNLAGPGAVTVGSGYVYVSGSGADSISSSNARTYFGTSSGDATVSSGGAAIVYTEAGTGDYTFNLSGTDSIFVGAGGGTDTVTLTGSGGHTDLVKSVDHTSAQIASTTPSGGGYTTITFSNSGQTLVVKGVDITYADGTKIAY